jgi:hypothetical protein
MKERPSKKIILTTSAMLMAGCSFKGDINSKDFLTDTTISDSKSTMSLPEKTATNTSTITPTSTYTPTPTPDWREVNKDIMETTLEGERVIFENLTVDRILVINPPLAKEYVFGLITNGGGETQAIIENFDCQYKALRDAYQLGEKLEDTAILLPADVWQSDALFEEIIAKKTGELGQIEIFTSEGFIYNNDKQSCEEYSTGERISDNVREILLKVISKFEGQ